MAILLTCVLWRRYYHTFSCTTSMVLSYRLSSWSEPALLLKILPSFRECTEVSTTGLVFTSILTNMDILRNIMFRACSLWDRITHSMAARGQKIGLGNKTEQDKTAVWHHCTITGKLRPSNWASEFIIILWKPNRNQIRRI